MITINAIAEAFKSHIKANVAGVKTVESHEGSFDQKTLDQFVPLSPFVLIRYGGLEPVGSERNATQGSGMKVSRFSFSIGSQNLLSQKEAAKGCYAILDSLRALYDGKSLVTAEGNVDLALEREAFLFSWMGLVVYGAEYAYFDS